jgi:hypothetical protein
MISSLISHHMFFSFGNLGTTSTSLYQTKYYPELLKLHQEWYPEIFGL